MARGGGGGDFYDIHVFPYHIICNLCMLGDSFFLSTFFAVLVSIIPIVRLIATR